MFTIVSSTTVEPPMEPLCASEKNGHFLALFLSPALPLRDNSHKWAYSRAGEYSKLW